MSLENDIDDKQSWKLMPKYLSAEKTKGNGFLFRSPMTAGR